MRRSKLFLLTFSFTLRDLGNCDDQSGGGRDGPGQPPGRTDDFSDSKFSQPQTLKHILSDTSSEIGEIGDGLQPIILSRITFIKSAQMSVPERGQTGWLSLVVAESHCSVLALCFSFLYFRPSDPACPCR